MLSPDEQSAFDESIRRVRAAATAQLREGLSPIQLVAELQRGVDRVSARAVARGVTLACQTGCAHCCQARVEALPSELDVMARTLSAQPAAERASLIERLQRHAEQRRAEPLARLPCALLAGASCSVYAMRPTVCRKAHSLDVKPCAEAASEIPQDLALLLDAEALMQGVGAALDQPAEELAAGLLKRLT